MQMKHTSENPHATDPNTRHFNSPKFFTSLEELEAVIGERILPLYEAKSPADPRLTAVDSRSALVVIEVCEVLDTVTLARALANAGRWSRLGGVELARVYPNGPQQFSADLTAFLSNASATEGAPTGQRTRLIILCAAVAPESVDAVSFLRDAGTAVGIRIVETDRRSVPRATGAQSFSESGPIPVAPPRASFPGGGRARSPARGTLPTATGPSVHAAAHDGPRLRSRVIREEATDTNQIDLSRTRRAQSGNQYAAAMAYGTPEVAPDVASPGNPLSPMMVQEAEPAAPVSPSGPRSERLAALAAQLTEPAAMVWTRLRREQRFDATLTADGVITLADGRAFADPDAAAAAAAGTTSQVDGWRAWRLGADDGPALAELG